MSGNASEQGAGQGAWTVFASGFESPPHEIPVVFVSDERRAHRLANSLAHKPECNGLTFRVEPWADRPMQEFPDDVRERKLAEIPALVSICGDALGGEYGEQHQWVCESAKRIYEFMGGHEKCSDAERDASAEESAMKPGSSEPATLVGRYERAYQSYRLAESQGPFNSPPTDQQAYEWLKEHGPEDYALPAFPTWQRYLRNARSHYGTQKHSPRAGRTGRSVGRPDDLQARTDGDSRGD